MLFYAIGFSIFCVINYWKIPLIFAFFLDVLKLWFYNLHPFASNT